MEFRDLLESCQVEAIVDKLRPSDIAVWEHICRTYSEKFHTPLHLVLEMSPEFVIKQFYGAQMDDVNLDDNIEKIQDIILGIEDPEYERNKEKDLDNFLDKAEEEEVERLKNGVSLSKFLAKKKPVEAPKPPKQGSIDLSYLEDEENGSEFTE